MDISKLVILMGLSGLGGMVIGYFLHVLITLQKRSSVQVKIKQQQLDAKDKAQQLITEAQGKAEGLLAAVRENEERVRDREGALDKRREAIEESETRIEGA